MPFSRKFYNFVNLNIPGSGMGGRIKMAYIFIDNVFFMLSCTRHDTTANNRSIVHRAFKATKREVVSDRKLIVGT